MILVHRICADCGRRFSFDRPTEGRIWWPEACQSCDPESHSLLDPMEKYLPRLESHAPRTP